jgi:hypothetical protein
MVSLITGVQPTHSSHVRQTKGRLRKNRKEQNNYRDKLSVCSKSGSVTPFGLVGRYDSAANIDGLWQVLRHESQGTRRLPVGYRQSILGLHELQEGLNIFNRYPKFFRQSFRGRHHRGQGCFQVGQGSII